jgi:ubiquinone/menaquinone biosynthesis C-methylase UbiE
LLPSSLRVRRSLYSYAARDWYSWVAARLPADGELVLDVGAGTGALWQVAARRGVVLCDVSASMCSELASVGAVVRASGAALPVAPASVDGAVATHSLYCLADPDAGLRELRRVVRPGGWAAVATNNADHLSTLEDVAGAPLSPLHLRFVGASAAERVAAAGFSEVEIHSFVDEFDVPDAEPVARYIAGMTAGAGIDDVAARAERAIEADNGALRLRRSAVLVVAR